MEKFKVKIQAHITNQKFTVVSFYTLDPIYKIEVSKLIKSLDTFNLDYYIEGIPPLGDWKTCTDYKARFIRRAIERVSTPIVWLDSDATVIKYPKLFDHLNADVSAFISHINHLLSGTVYFANNDRVRTLIDAWISANNRNTAVFEQKILQAAINKDRNIVFKRLPIGYCQIHDYKFQAIGDEKYVLHWQASRRTKRLYPTLPDTDIKNLICLIEQESEEQWKTCK